MPLYLEIASPQILLRCWGGVAFLADKYAWIELPCIAIADLELRENGINKDVLKSLDVFFYQIIKDDNNFSPQLSSNTILKGLKKSCLRVSYINAYFAGYYPQLSKSRCMARVGRLNRPLIPHGDYILNMMIENNMSPKTIWEKFDSDQLIAEDVILKNFTVSINELKDREKNCDVKISDYILENYRDKLLFYTMNHPCNELLKEICVRLMNSISINLYKEDIDDSNIAENDAEILILYPCVKKTLKLNFEQKECRCAVAFKEKSDRYEYISKYQEFCFKDYKYKRRCMNISHLLIINEDAINFTECDFFLKNGKFHLYGIMIVKNLGLNMKNVIRIPKEFAPDIGSYFCGKAENEDIARLFCIIDNVGEISILNAQRVNCGSRIVISVDWISK